MKRNKKNGFTLVELLAVIVILAIILVIAVPKVMSVIEDSKKATLESTAKMIASAAEKAKVQNTVLGKTEEITCDSVAKINKLDYETCEVIFEDNTAKVSIKGSGKFAGLYVCSGDKTSATATTESCTPVVNATTFEDDDWSTIVAAVKQAEKNGTEYPYEVGNTKTVEMDINGDNTAEEYTIRVSNKTKCSEVEVTSKTACGFVLEFADIITTHNMNGTDNASSTNAGGWPASEIRRYLNDIDENDEDDGVIYNAIPEPLREGIIDTYVVSSHGSKTTAGNLENENAGVLESSNYWSNEKLYLLSPQEVYGTSFTSQYDSTNGTSRQLDYYATYKGDGYTGVSITNYDGAKKNDSSGSASWWWLCSANSGNVGSFYAVANYGNWNRYGSYYSYGVSPAFRLAE